MINKKVHISSLLILFFGIGMVGVFTGCVDQLLNKDPLGEQTEAIFFETEEHAIQATNATYQMLREGHIHGHLWLGMTDIASDNADKGSVPADGPMQQALDDWTFSPSTENFLETWRAYYRGINRANQAIHNIPDIEEMDPDLQERLVAENKFLRGYFYFFLVRAFGGVPLITEVLDSDEFLQERAGAEEVFALIEQDLEDAINILPLKSEYPTADLGRITRGAAQGILAKVHLYQENYTEAEHLAREVIDSGEYSLYADYKRIFWPGGENSSESVFEVQAVAIETGGGGTPYSQSQGVRGEPNLGWGFNNPSDDLLAAYEPGDPRLGATVLFVYEELPFGPADAVRDNPQMSNERYNQKSFVPIDQPGGAASGNGGTNIRILRYADVLLTAAEAAFQNGNESDARVWVNEVRERARGGQNATAGIEPEPLAGLIADLIEDPGLQNSPFVRFVTSSGPGDEAGLESFTWVDGSNPAEITNLDIIEAVNGTPVLTVDEYIEAMSAVTPGDPVTIDIQRFTGNSFQSQSYTIDTEQLLPDVTSSGQDLLEAIWHERRVELAMEHHRLFDLRRTGMAGEVLRALGNEFQDGVHELYPIPTEEIQLSGGTLQQNPGYPN